MRAPKRRFLFLVPALSFLLWLLPDLRGEENTFTPPPLELEVRVPAALAPGSLEDPLDTILQVRVKNRTGRGTEGVLAVARPGEEEGGAQRIPFRVAGRGETTMELPLSLPAGKPREAEVRLGLEEGDTTVMAMTVRLSKVRGWYVIGPFEGGTDLGLDRSRPPEQGFEPAAVYEGKGGRKVKWHLLDPSAVAPGGYYDLNRALGATEQATAYARCTVHAKEAADAVLRLGSDDGVKVWLDGKPVHENAVHRGSAPGQDVVPVKLKQGANTFLLKVCNDDGGWGFHFDLVSPKGGPVPGLRYEVGVLRREVRDPEPRPREVTRTSAMLTWKSDRPVRSTVYVREAAPGRTLVWGDTPKDAMIEPRAGSKKRSVVEKLHVTDHAVRIEGLEPGTRYLAWAEPGVGRASTEKAVFYTDPPEGYTQYLVLHLAAVIFTNTTPPGDAEKPGAKTPCPPEEVERVKREMAQTVLFNWIVSGMRLFLDVTFFTTDRFYPAAHPLYGVGYSAGDEEAYKEVLRAAGRTVDAFDGRLFISMEKRWDEKGKRWFYPASGGGTIGPEAWPGYGKSAWRGGSNNAWLFCHEFNHQLDALYAHSLGPEFLFNHFQPWDGTAHRHGEHWDGIAWLMLEWAGYLTREHQGRPYLPPRLGYRYFINRWGEVKRTRDADGDGIPDADPRVPLDEARFGSDPEKKDTDGDGLLDMMEVLASHGVEYGLNEIWAGNPAAHRADPRRPDTDGDGVRDGEDPYPLYPIDPAIPKGEPGRAFAVFRDRTWEGKITLGWDDGFLYLGVAGREAPARIKILLDLDDDGWFMGADNYELRVTDGVEYRARFHNCGVEGKWPFFDEGRIAVGKDVFFESDIAKDRFAVRIRLAKAPRNGLALVPGERIGLLIALCAKEGNGRPGEEGDLTLFEPHTFFTVTLAGGNGAEKERKK